MVNTGMKAEGNVGLDLFLNRTKMPQIPIYKPRETKGGPEETRGKGKTVLL